MKINKYIKNYSDAKTYGIIVETEKEIFELSITICGKLFSKLFKSKRDK